MFGKRRHPVALLSTFALLAGVTAHAAAAQSTDTQPVVSVAPETSTTPVSSSVTQWQFARYTSNFGGGGYSWTTGTERIGDGNYRKFLAKLGLLGLVDHPSGEFALLDELGAKGWELVSCQTARVPGVLSESDVTACYFKRPVSARTSASSAP